MGMKHKGCFLYLLILFAFCLVNFQELRLHPRAMHPRQREVLLIGLAATAGSLDSWSYFGLAHVFIANMTGNTVMLGYSSATGDWVRAGGAALAIGCYAVGVFAGAWYSHPVTEAMQSVPGGRAFWPRRVSVILVMELALVLVAAVVGAWSLPRQSSLLAHALVGLGAVAVGLQSAAISAIKLPGIVTTYITGTWTTMIAGFAYRVTGEEPGSDAGEKRLALQAAMLAVYCASAAGAGLLMRAVNSHAMGWLPTVLLALVVLGAFIWGRRPAS